MSDSTPPFQTTSIVTVPNPEPKRPPGCRSGIPLALFLCIVANSEIKVSAFSRPREGVAEVDGEVQMVLESVEETRALGAGLAAVVKTGQSVFLIGDLGSGKTCLARGFLRAFYGDPDLTVPSPSYLLSLEYGTQGEKEGKVTHIDLYRLPEERALTLFNFSDIFQEQISLIEWPERLGNALVNHTYPPRIEVRFEGVGPQGAGRIVHIRPIGKGAHSAVEKLYKKPLGSSRAKNIPKGVERNSAYSLHPEQAGHMAGIRVEDDKRKDWVILGIETSCDDTAVAVVRGNGEVLAELIRSQSQIHQNYGGVVPKLAQKAHKAAIRELISQALRAAKISPLNLTAVAVTIGPGLSLCLQIGMEAALNISRHYQIPLIPIHHLEAHLLVSRLPSPIPGSKPRSTKWKLPRSIRNFWKNLKAVRMSSCCVGRRRRREGMGRIIGDSRSGEGDGVKFPFLGVLVSGGHSMFVVAKGLGDYLVMGSTLDDSIGEAFDKTARLLGVLAVPGGSKVEEMSRMGVASRVHPPLPRPLSRSKSERLKHGCDMSFAGLKTAVLRSKERYIDGPEDQKNKGPLDRSQRIFDLASAFQQRAIQHVTQRTSVAVKRALLEAPNITSVVLAGGVAANKELRRAIRDVAQKAGLRLEVPEAKRCTDNGVMVAWAGIERLSVGLYEDPERANRDDRARLVEIRPRWAIGPRHPLSVTQEDQLESRRLKNRRSEKAQC